MPVEGRILDTRAASSVGGYTTAMPAGTWRTVTVEGAGGVPASGVSAVVITFTALTPTSAGLVHADKSGKTPSAAVTYEYYNPGVVTSNTATMALGSDGKIQVVATTATDMLIDVQGYYTDGDPTAGGYQPVTPTRIVDTRTGLGLPHATLGANSTSQIQVTGHAGVPAGASGVMLNLTVINTTATSSYFTTYASDDPRPGTSANFAGSATIAYGQEIGLSTSGSPVGAFAFYLKASTINLLVDVVGYFTPAAGDGAFTAATARVYDSRSGGHTAIPASSTITVPVAGVNGVPAAGNGITAITTNITYIDSTSGGSGGYARVWASGASEPGTSAGNFTAPSHVSNMVATALGTDGQIKIHNISSDPLDVVIDVEGWFTSLVSPIASGQDTSSQYLTLQGNEPGGGGTYVTYTYRIGTTATFTAVPLSDVTPRPSAWPEAASSGTTFTAHTWDMNATVGSSLGSMGGLVQVQACFGVSATDPNPSCTMPANVTYNPTTFGGDATAPVGPGSLSLLKGDFEIDASDGDAAAALGLGGLSRTLTTFAPSTATCGPGGILGPSWTAALPAMSADADLCVTTGTNNEYVYFTSPNGDADVYEANGSIVSTPITYTGVNDAASDGKTITMTDLTHITMTDSDTTTTTWVKNGSSWQVDNVDGPGANDTASYTYNTSGSYTGLMSRVLATPPAGVSCATSPDTTPGCRSLLLNYQTITVGGSNVARLHDLQVSLPQATSANTITVAAYDYDTTGRLADEYDPRITPNLKTGYTYNVNGRLASLTPPGLNAWSFAYDGNGRLSTVSRTDPANGPAVSTIVYGVPYTGTSAPVALDPSTTGTWNETADLPVRAVAVFPPTHQPASINAASVISSDWPWASLHYLDVNYNEVNTAAYGAGAWQVTTSQFDNDGNDYWDLSAGNRAQALTPVTGSTDPYVAGLPNSYDRADQLASTTIDNPLDSSQVTDTYGPTHPVTLASGTTIDARDHINTAYDDGAPNSDDHQIPDAIHPGQTVDLGKYGLPTTVTSGPYNVQTNADSGYPDTQTTHTGYAAIVAGDPDGWTLAAPTTSTVQMSINPSSSDLITETRYDTNNRAIELRLPNDTSGSTPRTTDTTYYAAGTGSGACISASLAGLVCSTAPAAQPLTGDALAVTTWTYDQYGQPLAKTETYGSGGSTTVRTTTDTYDSADRLATSSTTVTPTAAGGTALPTISYSYAPATGLPVTASTGSGASLVTLTTGYDTIGRTVSYADASGNTSTMGYDLDSRIASLFDGKGTYTYAYDTSSEHRNFVTSEDVGVAGAPSLFIAGYDAAGNLAAETYPNGLTASRSYDNNGNPTSLVYAKSGSSWITFTATTGDHDRVVGRTGPQSSQTFAYDQYGRLTTVQDTSTGSCLTRSYVFDADSNRTSLVTYPAGSGGVCSTSTTPSTVATSYDQADRDTNPGYTFDTLGRSTAVPSLDASGVGQYAGVTGGLTVGYDSNDIVANESQGGSTLTFSVDPLQNRIATTTDGSTTTTNHFSNSEDSPSWKSTSPTSWIRNIPGPDGALAAQVDQSGSVTINLSDLEGNIVATSPDSNSAIGVSSSSDTTEYGAPRGAATAYSPYGWQGAAQRSDQSLGGLTLMGVRLYNPVTGRFLSVDPIAGGSTNAYDYCNQDPINHDDLNGTSPLHWLGFTRRLVSQGYIWYGWRHVWHSDYWYIRPPVYSLITDIWVRDGYQYAVFNEWSWWGLPGATVSACGSVPLLYGCKVYYKGHRTEAREITEQMGRRENAIAWIAPWVDYVYKYYYGRWVWFDE